MHHKFIAKSSSYGTLNARAKQDVRVLRCVRWFIGLSYYNFSLRLINLPLWTWNSSLKSKPKPQRVKSGTQLGGGSHQDRGPWQLVAIEGRDEEVPPGTVKVGNSKPCIPPGSRRLPAVWRDLRRWCARGRTGFSRLLWPRLMSMIPGQPVYNKLLIPRMIVRTVATLQSKACPCGVFFTIKPLDGTR